MLDQVNKYIHQARSITHLANLLNIPRSTLRDLLTRNNLPTDDIDTLRSNFKQPVKSSKDNKIDDLITLAEIKQKVSQVHQQHVFTLERTNEPVVFILWGDQHIGAAGTNHQGLKAEALAIQALKKQYPNTIVALNGDLIDGYFAGSKHSNNDQVLGIDEQRTFARWMLETIKPELAISADHEAWSIDSALDINFTKEYCEEHNINYAQWQAKLVVKFDNKLERTILVNHRYPGRTKLNPVKHLQALHNERGPADIVCCGHYHSAPGAYWMHSQRQNEDKFIGLQNGTNKLGDAFASKIGDLIGEYGIPAVVLLPDGQMLPFEHYQLAFDYLGA